MTEQGDFQGRFPARRRDIAGNSCHDALGRAGHLGRDLEAGINTGLPQLKLSQNPSQQIRWNT